jgi:hypothetical protein
MATPPQGPDQPCRYQIGGGVALRFRTQEPEPAKELGPVVPIKRHLTTAHHLTPNEYRQRWGLKSDYPMAAQITPHAGPNWRSRMASGETDSRVVARRLPTAELAAIPSAA